MSKPETGVQLAVDEDEDDDDENAAFMTTGRPDGKKSAFMGSARKMNMDSCVSVWKLKGSEIENLF